jgi:hypothetical protein
VFAEDGEDIAGRTVLSWGAAMVRLSGIATMRSLGLPYVGIVALDAVVCFVALRLVVRMPRGTAPGIASPLMVRRWTAVSPEPRRANMTAGSRADQPTRHEPRHPR